jgi:hypothetical protein
MPEIPTKNILRSGPVHCSRSTRQNSFYKSLAKHFSLLFLSFLSHYHFGSNTISLSLTFTHTYTHTHSHTHTHTLFSLTLKLTKHNQKLVWSFTARKIIYLVPTTICHFTQLSLSVQMKWKHVYIFLIFHNLILFFEIHFYKKTSFNFFQLRKMLLRCLLA